MYVDRLQEATPARRAGPVWYIVLYAAVMAAALPAFLLLSTERFSLQARFLAWLGLGLAVLPALQLIVRPASPRSTLAATGLLIGLYYHLAVFHERSLLLRWGQARLSDAAVDQAMLLAALAVPVM